MALTNNQVGLIDFLVRSEALTFGEFVTKSGRHSPYFINTGKFDDGGKISDIGGFYAAHLIERGLSNLNVIFGPAYKGIPLAVSTAIALQRNQGLNAGFAFDRKEEKSHGDKGKIVGHKIVDGDKVVLVDDVITAGTTMREVVPALRNLGNVEIVGLILAVDRCERGSGSLSAVQETEQTLGVPVFPIVTIHDIVGYLSQDNSSGLLLSPTQVEKIAAYLKTYGV